MSKVIDSDKSYDIEILDCTIRDGGYLNNWHFDKKVVRETYRALSKCGIDYMEIGFRGSRKSFDPDQYGLWRFSIEEDIREVTANINGPKLALMANYGKIGIDEFCDAKESVVDLIRVAVHKDGLKDAVSLLEDIKKKGYMVSLNAMGYTNYTDKERAELIEILKGTDVDYIYVADSYGSLFPNQIRKIFETFQVLPKIKIGFHPHNNLQMAFANTLEAIHCGVHIVDSTIYGMGRAAGNLPTEIIISFLENKKKDRYNSIPLLNIIDTYYISMQDENKWGYQLPYMLSGIFQCHPNYAKALLDFREYTIEEIWKAMNYIRKINPIGFSKSIINRMINEGIVRNFELNNIKGTSPVSHGAESKAGKKIPNPVSYTNRHESRNFLVLANGPSLKEYKPKIDQFIAKYDPIILGMNYIGNLFIPHYHAFNNTRRFIEYVDFVAPESRLLVGQHIPDKLTCEYTSQDYEKIYYDDILNQDFDIKNGRITTSCRTISVLLVGLAIVMGADRVFCAGMDGYLDLDKSNFHFYDEMLEPEDAEIVKEMHYSCLKFLNQIDQYLSFRNKEGINILTPTSYRTFYRGIENYI